MKKVLKYVCQKQYLQIHQQFYLATMNSLRSVNVNRICFRSAKFQRQPLMEDNLSFDGRLPWMEDDL